MSLDPTKLVMYGPFGIDFLLVAVSSLEVTGLKPDSLTLNVETKLGNMVFEDGDEEDWEEGRKLIGELLISELDTADIALIEAADNVIITHTNGKVVTVAATCRFFCSVDGGKTKVQIFKTKPLGSAMSTMFTVT